MKHGEMLVIEERLEERRNRWGTFLLFVINLCRAGDLLEYLCLLSADTEDGDGVALVARAWGWQGRGGAHGLAGASAVRFPGSGRSTAGIWEMSRNSAGA